MACVLSDTGLTVAAATADGADQAFDFGLDRVLDGLQVLIDQRR